MDCSAPHARSALYRAQVIALSLALSACGARLAPQGRWHHVRSGDTLSALSERYKSPLEDVIELNQIKDPSKINVGQKIFFPRARALSSAHLSQRAHLATLSRRDLNQTSRAAGSPGAGSHNTHTQVSAQARAALAQGHPPLSLVQQLLWPLSPQHIKISSPFGPRKGRPHKGVDLSAPQGTPTLAALPGVVSRVAFEAKGYGHYVIVQHEQGLESRYAHHSEVDVKEGERLERGARVGAVGNTGRSSGPHLHFELRYKGKPIDPLLYLPALP
jgi:murein DD-endopeptidase MepM/ murein hydrolase activator NlpD